MGRWCWPALRHAPAIWVERSNGTTGRVSAQMLSTSQLLRWTWKSEKPFATGIRNSELLCTSQYQGTSPNRQVAVRSLMRRALLTVPVLGLVWIGYMAWPVYDLLVLVRAIETRDVERVESWPQGSGQDDKLRFCLTAG